MAEVLNPLKAMLKKFWLHLEGNEAVFPSLYTSDQAYTRTVRFSFLEVRA